MSVIKLADKLIEIVTTSHIITSVATAVKEIMENSLDAGATDIEVKLENYGLDMIEIEDNGLGICKEDMDKACLPSYTTKIKCFEDLENVESYGFRGQSLNDLCQIADVSITTRTISDDLAMTYTMNNNGHIVDSKPSHLNKGLVVSVSNIFKNVPVGKKFWTIRSELSREVAKVKTVVKSLGIIHPSLHVRLLHKGKVIWYKRSVSTLKQSAMEAMGYTASKLHELARSTDGVKVDLLVPEKECTNVVELCRSDINFIMVFINKRPVTDKKLQKVMLTCIKQAFSEQISGKRYPISLVSIAISPRQVDVNLLEPNKTKVYLKEEDLVLGVVEDMLQSYYAIKPTCLESSAPVAATGFNVTTSDTGCGAMVQMDSNKTGLAGAVQQLSIGATGTLEEASSSSTMEGSHVVLPQARAEVLECDLCTSTSSQLLSNEDGAFTEFCKEVTPKMLQEVPGFPFTILAKVLVKYWNSLLREKWERYEVLADLVRPASRTPRVEAIPSRVKLSTREKFRLSISKEGIKWKLIQPVSLEPSDDITLAGQLRPSGRWVVCIAQELRLLRHWGLKEVVLYDELMRGHKLPLEELGTAITLDESILGEELWKLLLSLKRTRTVGEDLMTIESAGIAMNGFRVELKERDGHTTCVLKAVSSSISSHPVEDLREALTLVRDQGEDKSRLHHMRPLKVVNYIKEEAVRLCKEGARQFNSAEVEMLVKYWQEHLHHQQCCLHKKQIFIPIFTRT